MIKTMPPRQAEILSLLASRPAGLMIDELAVAMGISRPAARQHLTPLEYEKLVERVVARSTGGRPGHRYVLSAKGRERFPRQYSWFAGILLGLLKRQQGGEEMAVLMRELASDVAKSVATTVGGATQDARIVAVAGLMNQLGYDASVGPSSIAATNCVYHHLANDHPEVCEFDLELLRLLVGAEVTHESCMVRGGTTCRFRFDAPDGTKPVPE